MPKSLATRVTLLTLAAFILGIWGLGVYAERTLRNDMVRQIGERQMATASLVARQINYDMENRLLYLRLVADDLGELGLGDHVALQDELEERPFLLRDFQGGAYVVDAAGIGIAGIPASMNRTGISHADRDYLGHDGPWKIGAPVISKVLKRPTIPLSVPIRDKQGQVIGALVGVIDLQKPNFLDSISASRFGRTGYYLILDRKSRTIITSTGRQRVLEVLPPVGVNPQVDRHAAGIEQTGITRNPGGVEVLVSGKSVPIAGWTVLASLPTEEAFAPVRTLTRKMLVAALLMGLLAGGLMWWLLRRELLPVSDTVARLAERTRTGSATEPLPVAGGKEIGGLIAGFNALLQAINRRDEALRLSEARWQFAIEGSGDGLWDWNMTDDTVFYSNLWKRMLGYAPDEVGTGLQEWDKRVHPDDRTVVERELRRHFAGETPYYLFEHRLQCKDGSYKWVLDRGLVIERDADGKPVRAIGTHTDISARKRQESYLGLRNRMLEMLAGGQPLEAILQGIVAGIEDIQPDMLCSILLLTPDGKRFASGVAPSLPDFYNEAVLGIETGVGQGSCGTAVATGERVIVEDIANHPYWASYREIAARAGLAACWSQPILSAARAVLGSFAIYHRTPHAPDESDIRLIEEAAQLVSIALEQEAAQYNQRIAATAFESSKGMMITAPDTTILRVNRAFTAITGYSAQEAVGSTPKLLSSGRHERDFYAAMWREIGRSGGWSGEIWNKRKNGEIYPQHLTINAVRAENGSIGNYVASLEDLSQKKEADATIHHLAFYDTLTQLPNRRLMADRLEHALAASTRTGRYGALMMIDLDRFKTVNETLGYEAGDQLLKQVAARLKNCVFEGDTVARSGADEFILLLEGLGADPGEAASGAETAAKRILAALAAAYLLAGKAFHASFSVGITLFLDHGCAQDELLKQAEIAMNQAKRGGRNMLRFFDPAMQQAIAARADLEDELRKAVEDGQFELHYQPQVDRDGRMTGVEALIRWQHPERGLIPPCQFIPLAEDNGMITDIGDWVLETACARLGEWRGRPATAHLSVAINVSARQFNQDGFAAQVRDAVARHGIQPAKLKLELTESMLLDDVDGMIAKMTSLKEAGVGLELDDFGTGYSSLQYLKRLPIERLKIDQSFVRELVNDDNDKAIVRTIISMADSLNLGVIAEGVETEEQRRYLESQGCGHYQGYLFGRPGPAPDIEAYLNRNQA